MLKRIEAVWSYVNKFAGLTRHTLNGCLKVYSKVTQPLRNNEGKVITAVQQLKLLAIVNLPFRLKDIKNTAEKIFNSFKTQDKEGVALGSLSLVLLTGDILDDVVTFTNASLLLASKTPIAAFSAMGPPLAFSLLGLSTASKIVQLAKSIKAFREINNQKLKGPLSPEQIEKINELRKKIVVDSGHLVANAFNLTGLCLMPIPVPPALPFLFLGIGTAIKISCMCYQDLAP